MDETGHPDDTASSEAKIALRDATIAFERALNDRYAAECLAKIATLKSERDALREALEHIDALDPESSRIDGISESAAKGLVMRMGQIARAALLRDPA